MQRPNKVGSQITKNLNSYPKHASWWRQFPSGSLTNVIVLLFIFQHGGFCLSHNNSRSKQETVVSASSYNKHRKCWLICSKTPYFPANNRSMLGRCRAITRSVFVRKLSQDNISVGWIWDLGSHLSTLSM